MSNKYIAVFKKEPCNECVKSEKCPRGELEAKVVAITYQRNFVLVMSGIAIAILLAKILWW